MRGPEFRLRNSQCTCKTQLSLLHNAVVFLTCLSLLEYNPQLLRFAVSPVEAAIPQIHSNSILKCQDSFIDKTSLHIIGRGGGGVVYQSKLIEPVRQTSTKVNDADVVFKISLERSNDSIRNECAVLHYLSSQSVKAVEKCVSICDVIVTDEDISISDGHVSSPPTPSMTSLTSSQVIKKETSNNKRVGVLLDPYFNAKSPSTVMGSLELLSDTNIQQIATKNLIDACINILVAGVASSDLQYLVDSGTGEVLVIDFTEASILSSFSSISPTTDTTAKLSSVLATAEKLSSSSAVDKQPISSSSSLSNSFKTYYDKQLVSNFISELQSNIVMNNNYDNLNDYLTLQLESKLKPLPFYSFLFTS